MAPYWILFLMPAFLALAQLRPERRQTSSWPGFWRVVFVVLVLMIGLRHEVGADWEVYAEYVRLAAFNSLDEAVLQSDPAYGFLNWVAAHLDLGPYFVNTVGATFFAWGLVVFCRAQPRPWLALVVAMPYLVTVVAMGYTRQGVAIGLVMLGLVALSERRLTRFVVFIVLAATFHKSAVIMMPLAALAGTKRRIWTVFWVGLATALFYLLLLQESVTSLNTAYIETEYSSAGAGVRVAMNVMPAAIFLSLRRRFGMLPADMTFWTWMSLGAFAFVGLLIISPSSTAVDRVALYWIPLQLVVFARLPDAFGQYDSQNSFWVCAVVIYSATVLFVWLFFAVHAFAWLPYQFYPWVLLWR